MQLENGPKKRDKKWSVLAGGYEESIQELFVDKKYIVLCRDVIHAQEPI